MKLVTAFLLAFFVGTVGCALLQPSHTAADYEAAQLACVDKAQTRAEADACRCAVKQQFGRPCADGGQ